MSQLVLARGNTYRKGLIKRFLPNLELGPYFLIVSLIIFVTLITVIALTFSTRQVTKGYVLNKLESEHAELIRQGERSEMEISTVRSLNYIKESPQVQGMINPSEIVFLSPDSAIASR